MRLTRQQIEQARQDDELVAEIQANEAAWRLVQAFNRETTPIYRAAEYEYGKDPEQASNYGQDASR